MQLNIGSLNSGEHRLCRVLSKSGENLENMGQMLYTTLIKVRFSLHIFIVTYSGRMWRSSVPNFMQIGPKVWKVMVEIVLHFNVKFACHSDDFHEISRFSR